MSTATRNIKSILRFPGWTSDPSQASYAMDLRTRETLLPRAEVVISLPLYEMDSIFRGYSRTTTVQIRYSCQLFHAIVPSELSHSIHFLSLRLSLFAGYVYAFTDSIEAPDVPGLDG